MPSLLILATLHPRIGKARLVINAPQGDHARQDKKLAKQHIRSRSGQRNAATAIVLISSPLHEISNKRYWAARRHDEPSLHLSAYSKGWNHVRF
jgi:hypothetical protein